jgi:transcriptional regulator with XRE-family HTH domain
MNTETEAKVPAKATGRRYKSVTDLVTGEGLSTEVKKAYAELERSTGIVERLAVLRQGAGITQEEMAKHLGVTQGAISKLESGTDQELTIREISEYSRITGERIGLCFGKPMNHVEAVKAYALGIRRHLSSLAEIAHQDEELETAIQGFFGEAFFNILTILEKCQREMPAGRDFEVQIQSMEPRKARRVAVEKTRATECV